MANYATIQRQIDHGLGVGSRHIGQPFTGYRIGATAVGDFPTGWTTVLPSASFFRVPAKPQALEWTFKSTSLKFYDLIGDVSGLLLGDVLLQTDPAYANGYSYGPGATLVPGTIEIQALGLAWHFPVQVPTAAWLNRRVRVYRPASAPVGLSDGSQYWAETHDQDQPLVLSGGSFAFGVQGALASLVPCGIAASERSERGRLFPPSPPGMTPPVRYYAYLPPLPGYLPKEGDAIITEDDARYVVVHPFEQESGVVGTNLFLERTVSQV